MAKAKYPKNWWLKTSSHRVTEEIYDEQGNLKEILFCPNPQMISYAAGMARIRSRYKSNQEFYRALGLNPNTVRNWHKAHVYEDPQTGETRNYFQEWFDATVDKFKIHHRPYLEYHIMQRIEEGSDTILKAAAEAHGLIGRNLKEDNNQAKKGITPADIASMSKDELEKYKRKYLQGRVGHKEAEGRDDSSSGSERERMPDSTGTAVVEVQGRSVVLSNKTSEDS